MDEPIRNLEDQFAATTQTASILASSPGNIGASTNRINMPGAGNQQQNQGQATTSNEPGGLETNQNHHDV